MDEEVQLNEGQELSDGETVRFNYGVWKQLCMPFRILCPDCGGQTQVIETIPVVCPNLDLQVAEECPHCGRRLTARMIFVFD